MFSNIILTQDYSTYSIFHDFFQNIWSYSVDFFTRTSIPIGHLCLSDTYSYRTLYAYIRRMENIFLRITATATRCLLATVDRVFSKLIRPGLTSGNKGVTRAVRYSCCCSCNAILFLALIVDARHTCGMR